MFIYELLDAHGSRTELRSFQEAQVVGPGAHGEMANMRLADLATLPVAPPTADAFQAVSDLAKLLLAKGVIVKADLSSGALTAVDANIVANGAIDVK